MVVEKWKCEMGEILWRGEIQILHCTDAVGMVWLLKHNLTTHFKLKTNY